MSIVDRRGVQIDAASQPPDLFWRSVAADYVQGDPLRAKRLCILALREIDELPVEVIALAFGLNKGHVSRIAQQAAVELRECLSREAA